MSERSLSDLPEEERREAIKDGYVTVNEARERYKLNRNELFDLVMTGQIPVMRKGNRGRNGAGTVLLPVKLLVDHINNQLGPHEARG